MMSKTIETSWGKQTVSDTGATTVTYSTKKIALDMLLMGVGAIATYGLGRLVGVGLNHTPYFNEQIPQIINSFSGIATQNNLDGLFGLLGLIYGLKKSGVYLDDATLQVSNITITPFPSLVYKKK